MDNKYLIKLTDKNDKVLETEVCYGSYSDAVSMASSLMNSYNQNIQNINNKATSYDIIHMI